MKSFFRENPTIAFGLGLPLLLVLIFLLISGIPALLVAPPQYDVIYATGWNSYTSGLQQISVINQKVQVTYQGSSIGNRNIRLWRYNAKTGAVKEINMVMPPGFASAGNSSATPEASSKITKIDVPDLEGLTIDSSSIAPDGYEFSLGTNINSGYSHHIFTGIFYPSSYRKEEAVLTKKGRSIRLPLADRQYYNRETHLIGWVLSS